MFMAICDEDKGGTIDASEMHHHFCQVLEGAQENSKLMMMIQLRAIRNQVVKKFRRKKGKDSSDSG